MKSEVEIRAEIATLEHILCAPAYSKEYLRIQIHAAGKMAALEWVLSDPAPIHTDQPTGVGAMRSSMSDLYKLGYSAATPHEAAVWSVYGEGFGLRCYQRKEDAIREATKYFGAAKFTIRIWPDKSSLHVVAAPEASPEAILRQAITALQSELDDLKNCPVHARVDPPTNPDEREAR